MKGRRAWDFTEGKAQKSGSAKLRKVGTQNIRVCGGRNLIRPEYSIQFAGATRLEVHVVLGGRNAGASLQGGQPRSIRSEMGLGPYGKKAIFELGRAGEALGSLFWSWKGGGHITLLRRLVYDEA